MRIQFAQFAPKLRRSYAQIAFLYRTYDRVKARRWPNRWPKCTHFGALFCVNAPLNRPSMEADSLRANCLFTKKWFFAIFRRQSCNFINCTEIGGPPDKYVFVRLRHRTGARFSDRRENKTSPSDDLKKNLRNKVMGLKPLPKLTVSILGNLEITLGTVVVVISVTALQKPGSGFFLRPGQSHQHWCRLRPQGNVINITPKPFSSFPTLWRPQSSRSLCQGRGDRSSPALLVKVGEATPDNAGLGHPTPSCVAEEGNDGPPLTMEGSPLVFLEDTKAGWCLVGNSLHQDGVLSRNTFRQNRMMLCHGRGDHLFGWWLCIRWSIVPFSCSDPLRQNAALASSRWRRRLP